MVDAQEYRPMKYYSLRILCIKFAVILLLVSIFTWCGYKKLGCPAVGVDDANIFMVYAKHFSTGHGFVYNIGDEKVEGFSSLLYVLVLSLLLSLSSNPERLILLFNILMVSGGLTCVTAYLDALNCRERQRDGLGSGFFSFESLLVLAWTLSCPAYICWTTVSLMDTGLWSALLLVSSVLICHLPSSEGGLCKAAWYVCIPLMIIARPEALLWVPAMIDAYSIIEYLHRGEVKNAGRTIAVSVLIFVTTALLLTIYRLSYFGFPFPNTYYAKVSPFFMERLLLGMGYAKSFIISGAFTAFNLLCCPLYLLLVIGEARTENDAVMSPTRNYRALASIMSLIGLIIPILVGGDHFRWFRFYQFIWPLMVLPVLGVIDSVMRYARLQKPCPASTHLRYLIIGLVFLVFTIGSTPSWHDASYPDITHEGRLAYRGRIAGDVINAIFNQTAMPTLGVVSAGGIKYTYHGIVYDLMGLNNIAMAHSAGQRRGIRNHAAFNKEIFYRLNPHILLPIVSDEPLTRIPFNQQWYGTVLKGLLNDREFKARYSFICVRNTRSIEPYYLYGYGRNDFVRALDAEKNYDVSIIEEPGV
jgi:hypothetical protein